MTADKGILRAAEVIAFEEAALRRVERLADFFVSHGTVSVYESAAEIGEMIHAAIRGDGEDVS